MRILVVGNDKKEMERVEKYIKEDFHLLTGAEYVFANEYHWDYLADLCPGHGVFDALVITSLFLKDKANDRLGLYGLVFAAEAGKRGIPCVITIHQEDDPWIWNLAHKVGAVTLAKHEDFPYQMMIKLCEELGRREIDWH